MIQPIIPLTFRQLINAGSDASNEFPKWNKVKGKEIAGLTDRRSKERAVYSNA